jgi:putative glutathione S-transferase
MMMMSPKSQQSNRVQQELEALRQKQLAKSQRQKLKDCESKFDSILLDCRVVHASHYSVPFYLSFIVVHCPLTTPEEAEAFLAAMRDKSHQREYLHQPPSNISSSAGMDAWYLQQRQREKEMRQRRIEAEEILRGYRGGGRESLSATNHHQHNNSQHNHPYARDNNEYNNGEHGSDKQYEYEEHRNFHTAAKQFRTVVSSHPPETLDDPISFRKKQLFHEEKKTSEDQHVIPHVHSTEMSETETNHPHEPTVWLDFISNAPGSRFPPEPNRYHLYLSYACPGSHRALIVRNLKGLQDVVSVTFVHPTWRLTNPNDPNDKHRGWIFADPNGEPFPNTIQRGGPFPPAYADTLPDPIFGAYSIREIYERAGDTSGKYTIPLLWDTVHQTIVNNESSDIAYMLNSCFNDFAQNPELDLYTEADEEGVAKLNEVCDWLSPLMIHGVYRCGFAKNQRAYDRAISELCEAFDRADDILSESRFLTGDTLTDADIRLFVSLIRFDEVYSIYFKANARLVMLTPSLLNFCREIYQIPGIAETCDMDQIKAHFFGSHAEWNKYSVIPRGLGFMELLDMPHDRHLLTTLIEHEAPPSTRSTPPSYADF